MSYKEKLNDFNSKLKYHEELLFLDLLMCNAEGKILDYGCGTGYAVDCLREHGKDVFGYDATQYEPTFKYSPAIGSFEIVYFMHSIAHIPGIKEVIKALDTESIIVITPNLSWIRLQQKDNNYVADPTIIEHFTKKSLEKLFISCGFSIDLIGEIGQKTENHSERLVLKASKIK